MAKTVMLVEDCEPFTGRDVLATLAEVLAPAPETASTYRSVPAHWAADVAEWRRPRMMAAARLSTVRAKATGSSTGGQPTGAGIPGAGSECLHSGKMKNRPAAHPPRQSTGLFSC